MVVLERACDQLCVHIAGYAHLQRKLPLADFLPDGVGYIYNMTESVRLKREQRAQLFIGRRLCHLSEMKSDLQSTLVGSGECIPENLGISFL